MSKVSLIKSDQRYRNIKDSLDFFRDEIIEKIKGKKKILIKPDLSFHQKEDFSTNFRSLKTVLEFFEEISSLEVIILGFVDIGNSEDAFLSLQYDQLKKGRNLKLVPVKKEDCIETEIYSRDLSPIKTLIPKILLDPDFFKVSVANLKLDNRVITNFGIRNITNSLISRPFNHDGYKSINLSIAKLMSVINPDLSIIDGYQGIEGDPLSGDLTYLGVALSGVDFVSVDTISSILIGINPYEVGYLSHCNENKEGVGEISKIEIVGNTTIEEAKKEFRKNSNYESLLGWN